MLKDSRRDELVRRFFRRIPAEVAETFTPTQIDAIKQGFEAGEHLVNIRASLPFFSKHLYLAFILGREKRSRERIADDRATRELWTFHNIVAIGSFSLLLLFSLFGSLFMISRTF
jgi:hypothetical protein